MLVRKFFLVVLLVFLGTVLAGCLRAGQRLLDVHVEWNGTKILNAGYSVSDGWNKERVWKNLAEHVLTAQGNWKPDSPGEETQLKGKIRIILKHAGQAYITVDAEELKLVRDPSKPGQWKIAKEEVTRLASQLK